MIRLVLRSLFALVALVAIVSSGGVAGVYAYDSTRGAVLAHGISIAGVPVGGLDAVHARRAVEEELVAPLRRPLIVESGGRTHVFSADLFAVRADVSTPLAAALAASRDGDFLRRVYRDVRGDGVALALPLRVTHAEVAVETVVERLAAAAHRKPHEATMSLSLAGPSLSPSRDGAALDRKALRAAIAEALVDPRAGRRVAARIRVVAPKVSTADLRERYPVHLTVDLAERRLRLYRDLELVRVYPVAIGDPRYPTPRGHHTIVNKAADPSWHVPNSDWAGDLAGTIVPPGPDNPIVARWLGIHAGAGIHGTRDLGSLGRAASHGCIRMAEADVIDLYDRVPVGAPIYLE